MLPYVKNPIDKAFVSRLHRVFGLDVLTASILVRRGLKDTHDLLFHNECDERYFHSPFLFDSMEDAVSLINDALESGEPIFIFGDSDVDGMMATVILYRYLRGEGARVTYRIPKKGEPYGITCAAIDEFILSITGESDKGAQVADESADTDFGGGAAKRVSGLVITVDNGISCIKEIEYATSRGLDVIITDHHNAPAVLPFATVIIDAKVGGETYPFSAICGAQVSYKLVSALRFSKTALYESDITFMDVHIAASVDGDAQFVIECVKTRNLIERKRANFTVKNEKERAGVLTHLADFLTGSEIFVWNKARNEDLLERCFGRAVEFSLFDAKSEIIKVFPKLCDSGLADLIPLSRLARYAVKATMVDSLFNIFITYTNRVLYKAGERKNSDSDLQLAALATIADVMPLLNENKIFARKLVTALDQKKADAAIMELAAANNVFMPGKRIVCKDISFGISPLINAAGKMGDSDLVMALFLESDNIKKQQLALKIMDVYNERKKLVDNGLSYIMHDAQKSVDKYKKVAVVFCDALNSAIVGLLASKLCEKFNIPSVVMTKGDDKISVVGSMRTKRGVCATAFLKALDESGKGAGDDEGEKFFTNYGGHDKAAGFSFPLERLGDFWPRFEEALKSLTFNDTGDLVAIDAELPVPYLNDEILKVVDEFEPYGEQNKPLVFLTQGIHLKTATIIGKGEKKHLKVLLDTGTVVMSALFWGREDLFKTIQNAKRVNILYNVERNYFNGLERAQLILQGIEPCDR